MRTHFSAPADLYLGSNHATAIEQGPRSFRSVAHAIRFALEQAAPVSLRGARLRTSAGEFNGEQIKRLYASRDYPFIRKDDMPSDPDFA